LPTREGSNFFGASYGYNAFAAYRQGLKIWMLRIAGEDLAIRQNHFWRLLLSGASG
jgi:hypothetical protein